MEKNCKIGRHIGNEVPAPAVRRQDRRAIRFRPRGLRLGRLNSFRRLPLSRSHLRINSRLWRHSSHLYTAIDRIDYDGATVRVHSARPVLQNRAFYRALVCSPRVQWIRTGLSLVNLREAFREGRSTLEFERHYARF